MTCQQELRRQGKPYPRTCQDCGLGPCKHPVQPHPVQPHPAIHHSNPPFHTMKPEAQEALNEVVEAAVKQLTREQELLDALKTAVRHIEHMAAWISKNNTGYSFESLGEDIEDLRKLVK